MNFVFNWWNRTSGQEKFVQFVAFLFVFGFSSIISGGLLGAPMGLACLYIVYDCIKKRSLAGFYMPVKAWLGLVLFLLSVIGASLLLGHEPSIHMALDYAYWAIPFPVLYYLGKQADIRYAALLGAMLSLGVSSANVAYTEYLLMQGQKIKLAIQNNGRIGAFDRTSNIYALLVIGILPLLFAAFKDEKLRARTGFLALQIIVSAMGLWALWKTGSRGAMLGLCLGGFFVFLTVRFRQQIWKALTVVLLTVTLLISGYAFWGIVPGGKHGYDDTIRLHLLKSSWAMWRDHKVSGVGLAKWEANYAGKYFSYILSRKRIQNLAVKRYAKKKHLKIAAIPRKTRIAIQKSRIRAISRRLAHSHNNIAWFFSTTGTIGGAGYLIFVFSFIGLFVVKIKAHPKEWIFQAGLWILLAVTIHGMVDSGIIYKGGARLLYVMLGITASYRAGKADDLATNQS